MTPHAMQFLPSYSMHRRSRRGRVITERGCLRRYAMQCVVHYCPCCPGNSRLYHSQIATLQPPAFRCSTPHEVESTSPCALRCPCRHTPPSDLHRDRLATARPRRIHETMLRITQSDPGGLETPCRRHAPVRAPQDPDLPCGRPREVVSRDPRLEH